MDSNTDGTRSDHIGPRTSDTQDVALCFKVPFRFRQWFKLQALNRHLTMTEFLMQAAQWYSEVPIEAATRVANGTDLRK